MPSLPLSLQTQAFSTPALRRITLEVAKVGGINLGQGVCNLPTPEYVVEAAAQAARDGVNKYTNPRGLDSLRKALAGKLAHFNGIQADSDRTVLATCGATGAFEAVCACLLNPGDEAVIFEPSYPYHLTALRRYQANVTVVPLEPGTWAIDFDRLRAAITPRTKFLLVNTPNNPTGKVFTRRELETIRDVLAPTGCLLVTDEIYEYMAFATPHLSAASIPGLADRTLTMGGYSKTFSITGWRIGYLVVPEAMSDAFPAFLDAVYVCPPAPLQEAVARGIEHFGDGFYGDLRSKYQAKRDRFAEGLRGIGLSPEVPQGAYYLVCGFGERFPGLSSMQFVSRMIAECGVGAVPSDDFVADSSRAPWVRFCLANDDSVLEDALERLARLTATTTA